MKNLYITVKDPNDHATIDALAKELADKSPNSSVDKTYAQIDSTATIKHILDKVFYGLISVTMFLCFFSLSASMSANLYE